MTYNFSLLLAFCCGEVSLMQHFSKVSLINSSKSINIISNMYDRKQNYLIGDCIFLINIIQYLLIILCLPQVSKQSILNELCQLIPWIQNPNLGSQQQLMQKAFIRVNIKDTLSLTFYQLLRSVFQIAKQTINPK